MISQLRDNDKESVNVNLNNVPLSDGLFQELFDALRTNETLTDLSMANTMMSDSAAVALAAAVESNQTLEKLNIESNSVNPHTLIKIFEVRIFENILNFFRRKFFVNSSCFQLLPLFENYFGIDKTDSFSGCERATGPEGDQSQQPAGAVSGEQGRDGHHAGGREEQVNPQSGASL